MKLPLNADTECVDVLITNGTFERMVLLSSLKLSCFCPYLDFERCSICAVAIDKRYHTIFLHPS